MGRRAHGAGRLRRDHVARRQEPRPEVATSGGGTREGSLLLPALPQPAHKPPPRLHHDPQAEAPVTPDRTAVECEWLFSREAVEQKNFDPSYASDFWHITNGQDWAACEGVQRGASSRGYRQGPLSPEESTVGKFVGMIARGYLEGRVVQIPGLRIPSVPVVRIA